MNPTQHYYDCENAAAAFLNRNNLELYQARLGGCFGGEGHRTNASGATGARLIDRGPNGMAASRVDCGDQEWCPAPQKGALSGVQTTRPKNKTKKRTHNRIPKQSFKHRQRTQPDTIATRATYTRLHTSARRKNATHY